MALPSLYVLIPALYIAYQFITSLYDLYRNVRVARASGIPYAIAPWFGFANKFLLTEPIWRPIAIRLPTYLREPWLSFTRSDWAWYYGHEPFKAVGSDSFMLVSYAKILLYTCDADVINQITTRRNDFPKPVEIYGILDLYGKNVVTVEGAEWRRHRKVTGSQFNEKSNAVVWHESIFQAKEMVRSWKEGIAGAEASAVVDQNDQDSPSSIIYELGRDTMKLSLHVISMAGFGVRCMWPLRGRDGEDDAPKGSMSASTVPPGHVMSYVQSLETLLHHVLAVIILPNWFLRNSPSKVLRQSATAFKEWGQYMTEIYNRAVDAAKLDQDNDNGGLDLMGAMVRGSGVVESSTASKGGSQLTPSEILGNSFVMFLAGHETAANSIHFALVFLATRPDIQRKLQAELDESFGDSPPDSWDYDRHVTKLFAGWAGAIMNEELRLVPPVINIPKSVLKTSPPQPIKINGRDCLVPPGAGINLAAVCVHRNPKYWAAGSARKEDDLGVSLHKSSDDLAEFKPERWFLAGKSDTNTELQQIVDADTGVDLSPDIAATMLRPPKGAYIPFSEGFRACLGRRFAQVEILATLAVIFRDHSIELCTDAWATTEEVSTMDREHRREIWDKEKQDVERKLREEVSTVITLQLRGTPIRLRVCKRGHELYDF